MKYVLIGIAAVAVVIISGYAQPTFPAESDRIYMAWGSGQVSCGAWFQQRKPPQSSVRRYEREQWLLGFLSAYNLYNVPGANADVLAGSDAEGAFAWVDNWCEGHSLETLSQAAAALVNELEQRRQSSSRR